VKDLRQLTLGGGSIGADAPGFQLGEGGATPTPPLQCYQRTIRETRGAVGMPMQRGGGYREICTLRNGMTFGIPSRHDAQRFIERHEWLGHAGRAYKCFAIWRGFTLYGVELFQPPPWPVRKALGDELAARTWMLARGACSLDAGPHAATMLIGASLRALRKEGAGLVVAYSDPRAGETGRIYRAANAASGGITSSTWTYYLINGRWYNQTWRPFGKAPKDCPYTARRDDATVRLRWYWKLDPLVSPPKSWR
jgi:hypothetical protein